MADPQISVLIPCYNGAKMLPRAMQSILDQDFTDFELLVIDDGSTDNSRQIIADFAKKDSRIRPIYHDKNMGLAETLNEGIRLSRAPLVARLDHDDEALPNRLHVQYDFMQNNPDIMVAGSNVYYAGVSRDKDKLITLPADPKTIARALEKYNCMFHPSVMLRKDAIVALGGYRKEFKNAEDYDLWLRVSRVGKLANIQEPLIRYTFSVQGMTLGKKWQQLRFVYLAQAAHRTPERTLPELEIVANTEIENTNRREFFNCVVTGTLKELTELGLWFDGIALIASMGEEVGFKAALSYYKLLMKAFFAQRKPIPSS